MGNATTKSDQALRLRAIERFELNQAVPLETHSHEETKKLLHELQVHQIELEMQNEELRHTHYELEVARSRYFDLYDLAPVGYLTLSKQGLILEANLTSATLLGVDRGALVKIPFSRLIHKTCQGSYHQHLTLLLETGMPQSCELRMVKKEGVVFWAHLSITLAGGAAPRQRKDTDGEHTFRVALSDISAKKRAEEMLVESEKQYSNLFNNRHVVMFLIEPETGKILISNPAARSFYGYSNEQFAALKISDINVLFEKDVLKKMEQVMKGETSFFHFRHRLANGEIRDVEVYSAPIEIRERKLIYFIVHDVTARKCAEAALKKLNEELEYRVLERTAEIREKDKILLSQSRQAAMGEMIGNIAHQWRQPLNILALMTQGLLLYYDHDELNRELLEKTVRKSMEIIHHMSDTIDSFRNYFSPDKEKLEFKVYEAIAHTVSLIEDSFKSQHIDIEVVAKDDPVIFGYRNEFLQVILNILNNCKDVVTERGIENPWVMIAISIEGKTTVITISDNAGGIPEEIINKIFDPYFTTKGPQSGTGIGLFMSKAIIEKNMGGTLVARNNASGAEFRIELQNGVHA